MSKATSVHTSRDFNQADVEPVAAELRDAVGGEWVRFLKERLEQMEESEVEYHNV